jgi:prolyl oligopeptidase
MHPYPEATRLDIVDDMHGQAVPDPYRWLEDTADPRTETWSTAQDRLVEMAREGWADRDTLRSHLETLHAVGEVGAPRWRGARAFALHREPEQDHPVLVVTETSGEQRVLLDPMKIDPSGTTTLDFWAPSNEGDLLAYGLSEGGTEDSIVRVLDVGTGAIVDGPIDRARYTPIGWVPGGKAFFYVRHVPFDSEFGEDARFYRRIYLHETGSDPDTDVLVYGEDASRATYFGVDTSDDGDWLAITASRGTDARNDLWLVDISDGPGGSVIPVQVDEDALIDPAFAADGTCYVLTNRDAPRWRVCTVDPTKPDVTDWREIIAEDETAVINDFAVLASAGLAVIVRTRHAVSEVTVHAVATGQEVRRIALPGLGSVTELTTRHGVEAGTEFWITYTDFTTPPRVLHVDAATGDVQVWASPPGSPEQPTVTARQITYTSYDGTPIHMFVLEPVSSTVGPRPTILYGYGGFNISVTPAYSPLTLAWVAHGGVYAIASLRGGSEEGEAWHRDGMREHKQNVFDDFAAASDWLVEAGVTTRGQLGIYGGSNGGLLVGAALTQHPEKYAAVVCSKPLLDMLRYELHGLGETWNGEYGTVEDPTEFGWLRAYSPYHNVHDGTDYPAVLFTVFEGDTRVDTLHARKMCAELQHATSGERPILIRRELNVGHANRSVSRAVELAADHAAFLVAQLG